MLFLMKRLMALACGVALVGAAHAATTVRVLETYPQGEDVTLPSNQNFYLRLAYSSDEPVGIWIAPMHTGQRARAGTSGSGSLVGEGETSTWLFLHGPGEEIDEIQISAGDGLHNHVVATHRVHIVASNASNDAGSPPAWVTDAQAHTRIVQRQALDTSRSKPMSLADIVLASVLMPAVLGLCFVTFALPVWMYRRLHGGWRIATVAPMAILGLWLLNLLIGIARDPSSHNLWPLEIVMFGLLSNGICAVLLIARKLAGKAIRSN